MQPDEDYTDEEIGVLTAWGGTGEHARDRLEWMRAMRDEGPTNRTTRLVLYTLFTFMNKQCEAWPSYPKIAVGAAMSVRTAKTHVGKLVKAGWLLRRHKFHRSRGHHMHNVYAAAYPPRLKGGSQPTSETLRA